MNTLTQEIQDAIHKNLPALLSKELIDRLTQGEAALAKIEQQDAALTEWKARAEKAEKLINNAEAADADLKRREKDIGHRENVLFKKEAEAEATLRYVERAKGDIYRLVETVFRNPVVRQHSAGMIPVKDRFGAPVMMPNNSTTETHVEGTGGPYEPSYSR